MPPRATPRAIFNFSFVHDGDAGGEIAHDRHGVGDEQVSQAEVALELGKEIDDLGADADVKRGDGLVTTMNFGRKARARAMPMRWRCPPENSWG